MQAYLRGQVLTPGWTSMLFVTMILGSTQLFSIGILSEYLARMYSEQKHRPVYIVNKSSRAQREQRPPSLAHSDKP